MVVDNSLSLEFKTGSLPKRHAAARQGVVYTDLRTAGENSVVQVVLSIK